MLHQGYKQDVTCPRNPQKRRMNLGSKHQYYKQVSQLARWSRGLAWMNEIETRGKWSWSSTLTHQISILYSRRERRPHENHKVGGYLKRISVVTHKNHESQQWFSSEQTEKNLWEGLGAKCGDITPQTTNMVVRESGQHSGHQTSIRDIALLGET